MRVITDELSRDTSRTPIQEFYVEQNVFITGGTGFLGKVLVEKLLRSCPDLSTIYLLIRPKKGKDVQDRLEEIFNDPVFSRLKVEQPKYRHKIVAVSGDCSVPNLGLSPAEKDLLIRKVSIVFHVAATVRFDEKIKYAVAINVSGTKEMLELSRSMHNLKSVVHVSTAYSHCNRLEIDEKYYPAPISADSIEKLTESVDEDRLNKMTPTLLGDFPNTYTFTKAIAEDTVRENSNNLPLGIFRPAIVLSTSNEPVEGWIDNVFGPTGGIVGAGAGLIRTLNINSECRAELIPVDMTVSALIALAWDVAKKNSGNEEPPIYNYVGTWDKKGITWGEYNDYALKYGTQTPSVRSIWCYVNYSTKYKLLYNILTIILHIIPALILDAGLLVTGKSPKLLKMYKKIHKFAAVTSYFSQQSWTFRNENTRELWNRLSSADKKLFFFSMENFDWNSYMQKYITGLRLYIFKDDPSTIPAARKRMAKMMIIHNIIKYTLLAIFLWTCYKLSSLAISFCQGAANENVAAVR